jgi:hypothetical protein
VGAEGRSITNNHARLGVELDGERAAGRVLMYPVWYPRRPLASRSLGLLFLDVLFVSV